MRISATPLSTDSRVFRLPGKCTVKAGVADFRQVTAEIGVNKVPVREAGDAAARPAQGAGKRAGHEHDTFPGERMQPGGSSYKILAPKPLP